MSKTHGEPRSESNHARRQPARPFGLLVTPQEFPAQFPQLLQIMNQRFIRVVCPRENGLRSLLRHLFAVR